MLYQSDSPYLFDSSKFAREFGFAGTPYATGIRETAAAFASSERRQSDARREDVAPAERSGVAPSRLSVD